ncbi:hypothetical protein FIBSPDRAFT_855119 [Athelia psychrophila]|uniref:Uncharacterized protein n=1 Tax=Athelia psychrophila TaxID=1759441 RepID=A0A166PJE7_9AGAM|nr:hypothetical protein FIBSPDRAFT_855119 [Fibularhizoctonia sp. CBS 109695]
MFYRLPARRTTANGCACVPCCDQLPASTPAAAPLYANVHQPPRDLKMCGVSPGRLNTLRRPFPCTRTCAQDHVVPRQPHRPSAPHHTLSPPASAPWQYVRGTSMANSMIPASRPDKECMFSHTSFSSPLHPIAAGIHSRWR